MLGALLVLVLPLALAWWLLGRDKRPPRRRREPDADREKIPR